MVLVAGFFDRYIASRLIRKLIKSLAKCKTSVNNAKLLDNTPPENINRISRYLPCHFINLNRSELLPLSQSIIVKTLSVNSFITSKLNCKFKLIIELLPLSQSMILNIQLLPIMN